ncbi:hypothetical protein GGI12_000355 [Dipsacomyces acuminosporus]|nr:hypothetical protein GGI12_000355 [Dipsacomyces acuminosporus]
MYLGRGTALLCAKRVPWAKHVPQRYTSSAVKHAKKRPEAEVDRDSSRIEAKLDLDSPRYSKVVIRQGLLTSTIRLDHGSEPKEAAGPSTSELRGQDAGSKAQALEFRRTLKALSAPLRSSSPTSPGIPGIPGIPGSRSQTAAKRPSLELQDYVDSMVKAFLPADYKNSVTREYIPYTKWQFVHNVLGSASGVLSTQAMLYAMGLGAGSLPLSAAINWILKDGFGQLGGVAYATMVGQKFDSDPKHQRFWSTVWLQGATWLEMLTPLAPHMFLLIGSIANIGKNISWLAMSATKASINRTFCRKENLGDLTAKYGSQATAAGLLGTAAGVLIGATMDVSIYTLILGFIPISLASIWANYKSLSYAITPTLNLERAQNMVNGAITADDGRLVFNPSMLRSPRHVSATERFMKEIHHVAPDGQLPGIVLSPALDKLHHELPRHRHGSSENRATAIARMVSEAFEQPNSQTCGNNYYVGYLANSAAHHSANGNLYIWFSTHASSSDILLGFYHAMALRQLLGTKTVARGNASEASSAEAAALLKIQSQEFARRTFDEFCTAAAQKGWDLSTMYFAKKSKMVDVEAKHPGN